MRRYSMCRTTMPRWITRCLMMLFVTLSPCHLVTLSSETEPHNAEDIQIIHELRSRDYSYLALQYLDKLAKTAPPALQKELALEIASTKMEEASKEPDSGKRIALYTKARADFQTFLQAN